MANESGQNPEGPGSVLDARARARLHVGARARARECRHHVPAQACARARGHQSGTDISIRAGLSGFWPLSLAMLEDRGESGQRAEVGNKVAC